MSYKLQLQPARLLLLQSPHPEMAMPSPRPLPGDEPCDVLKSHAVLAFDTARWEALRSATAEQVRCPAERLGELHEVEQEGGFVPRKNCFRTTGKRANHEARRRLELAYEQFVCQVVASHIAEM